MSFSWNRRTVCVGVAAVAVVVSSALDEAQTSVNDQRETVVRVRIERDGAPDETAAGVIIGWSATRIYVVTACHALFVQCGAADRPIKRIAVARYRQPEGDDATVFDRFDAALDIAIVSTSMPADFVRQSRLTAGEVEPAARVRLIGHPASGDWGVWTGEVQNENGTNGEVTHFAYAGMTVPEDGFSGGAMFDLDTARFLGLHSRTPSPKYGLGSKAGDILRQVQAWQVPVTALQMNQGGPARTAVSGTWRGTVAMTPPVSFGGPPFCSFTSRQSISTPIEQTRSSSL